MNERDCSARPGPLWPKLPTQSQSITPFTIGFWPSSSGCNRRTPRPPRIRMHPPRRHSVTLSRQSDRPVRPTYIQPVSVQKGSGCFDSNAPDYSSHNSLMACICMYWNSVNILQLIIETFAYLLRIFYNHRASHGAERELS